MRPIIIVLPFALAAPVAGRLSMLQYFKTHSQPTSWSPKAHETPNWTIAGGSDAIDATNTSSSTSALPNEQLNPPPRTNILTPRNQPDPPPQAINHTSLLSSLSLPPSCFRPFSTPLGFLPPPHLSILSIQNLLAPHTYPCTYGAYAHITSPTHYDTASILTSAREAAQAGAVLTLSLQPFIRFEDVDAGKVVEIMEGVRRVQREENAQKGGGNGDGEGGEGGKGPEVIWLRLAHEFNWYTTLNSLHRGPTHYPCTPASFLALWHRIATTVDRSFVKMFWSPNIPSNTPNDTLDALERDWWPGEQEVDIVGLDVYPQAKAPFCFYFGAFCERFAGRWGLPMQLAETGWLGGGTGEEREWWFGELVRGGRVGEGGGEGGEEGEGSGDEGDCCENYVGFTWFEYYKPSDGGDFRVVTGREGNLAREVLVREGWV